MSALLHLQAADLEAFLFQKDEGALEKLGDEANQPLDTLFGGREIPLLSTGAASGNTVAGEGLLKGEEKEGKKGQNRALKPAWEDPDDDEIQINVADVPRLRKLRQAEEETTVSGSEYQARLREQHKKLNPKDSWASLQRTKKSSESAETERLLSTAGGLLSSSQALPPGRIEVTRLKDANFEEPNQSVVQSVEFHPNGQLMMTAGLDRRLRFFSVDGVTNPHIQSIYLEDTPIQQAAFTSGGAQVVAAGRRPFFYIMDLESASIEKVAGIFGREERSFESFVASPSASMIAFFGRDGCIPLVSSSSRQAVGTLKMNGTIRSGAFSANGYQLMTSGGDGVMYVWDLRMHRCLRRYVDEGSTGGTALATSPNGAMFASGSKSGIVNVYRHPKDIEQPGVSGTDASTKSSIGTGALAGTAPEPPMALQPLRALPHLVTSVDSLAFNHDGQLLAMGSRLKRDALRLIHVPTLTSFSNWPTSKSPLHYVHSLAFSPSGGYLAIGNARGRVVLYRIHHYSQT